MKKIICTLLLAVGLTACGGAKYNVRGDKAAPLFEQEKIVYIVENANTREGFLSVMQEWLSNHSYKVKIVPTPLDVSVPYLTYVGRWAWDGGIFLSEATVTSFQGGERRGKASLKVPNNFNFNKYGDTEGRIHNLMSLLFLHRAEQDKKINVVFEVE